MASPRSARAEAAPDVESLMAEVRWLKSHYEGHLRAAQTEIVALRSHAADHLPVVEGEADAETARLRAEVERMRLAESRYLDRIEELKEQLEAARSRPAAKSGR